MLRIYSCAIPKHQTHGYRQPDLLSRLFADPDLVKPCWCTTGSWGAKLLLMSVSIYTMDCVHLCHLLSIQHHCLCADGREDLPSASHPPTGSLHTILMISQELQKLSQKRAVNTMWHSQLQNTSSKTALLIQQIWYGFNVAQENHSCFNI